ncbi:MAG: hypothetical protein CVU47_09950 [Chloroflexi bacterium HGW-Chloroflexi-9]|nr:MAG: hypothetical protein CVU47_09950 [Chloroflexi bacterium HGW-Chloroflexi-9]
MVLHRIVAPAFSDIDVADTDLRARLVAARSAWRARRAFVLLLTLLPVAAFLLTERVPPTLIVPVILFVLLSETEVHLTPRLGSVRAVDVSTVAFRVLYSILAVFAVEPAAFWPWVLPVVLVLMIVNSAALLPGWGLACVTLTTSLAHLASSHLGASGLLHVETITGSPVVRLGLSEVLAVSFGLFPLVALFLYVRTRHVIRIQRTLEGTITELRLAQNELQSSQGQLRRYNEQLSEDIERQTSELEERNRSLSILNAVSFALAEPMDDQRALERAARLVARLLGVRAAQAYHRTGTEEAGHLFVTVAAEDIHAPRLPEVLLRAVATTGRPLSSERVDWEVGVEVPDLGEPYAVVPLVAKGRVLGALALIGAGNLRWDDDGRHLLLLIGREMGVALENARLFAEAMEKAAREEFLAEVSRLMNGEARGERTLQQALTYVGEHLGAREVLLLTVADGGRTVKVWEHVQQAAGTSWLLPLSRTLPGLVADRYAPVVLGSGGEGPLSARLASLGAGTLALAPVIATRGRPSLQLDAGPVEEGFDLAQTTPALSAVLVVAMDAGAPWYAEGTKMVRRVSDLVARRMEADELVALQQQRIHELTGLAEVARSIQSTADIERLFAAFATALYRLVPYRRLYAARLDEFGDLLPIPVFAPRGRVLQEAAPVAEDRDHPWFGLRAPVRWRSGDGDAPPVFEAESPHAVIIPMRPKGQMLGSIVVGLDEAAGSDELHILEQAVEQLALALDGTLLYQQATARASHIQALSNLARIVASVVDLREAFAAFAEEMRWLIPFDRAVMLLMDETAGSVQTYATYPETGAGAAASLLSTSIATVPVHAGTAVVVRRDDPAYANLDWEVFGSNVAEVAAVPVKQGNRTAAVFALIHSSQSVAATDSYEISDLAALDEVGGLLGVTIERLRLYEQAEHGARHDLLTGLPNYRFLQERFEDLHAGIDGPGESAVLVIDMDNLKIFNDSLGHETGDRVIQIVARELRAACREQDFVARTGGDEFVVIMEGASTEGALSAAERIHAGLEAAHEEIPGVAVRISVSIGIASAPLDTGVPTELIPLADQAMYEAKFGGGHRTALARDRGADVGRGPMRIHNRRLAESLVRTVLSGADAAETAACALAQRWVAASVTELGGRPEAVPQLRMLVALEASRRIESRRDDEDTRLGRYFLEELRRDWASSDRADAREIVEKMIPDLVGIAWRVSGAKGAPFSVDEALRHFLEKHPGAQEHPSWETIEQVIRKVEADRRRQQAA